MSILSRISYPGAQCRPYLLHLLTKLLFEDLDLIYRGLQELPAFTKLRDSALRSLCAMVRYQRSDANDILYW